MIESFKLPNITPETISGSIVSFNDEYGGLPLKSCTSLISGYQEGSGTPSPSNIRPLYGWSGAVISHCGVNLWTLGDQTFTQYREITLDNIIPSGTYTLSGVFTSADTDKEICVVSFVYSDNTSIATTLTRNTRTSAILTFAKNVSKIRLYASDSYVSGAGDTATFTDLQLELGSTATPYEPYNGNTYTFTFGQSIYQGSIDWKRGVVTATWGYVDIGSLPLEKVTNVESEYWTALLPYAYKYIASQSNFICNKYTKAAVGATGSAEGVFITSSSYVRVRDLSVSSASEFNGTQLAYELATPIEIPLGGINLLTQEGQNNIFADCGNTSVTHLKVT